MSLPALSNLCLQTSLETGSLNDEHRDKRQKPADRVQLFVSEESEVISGERGIFHSGCISVVEMAIAKVVCDAFLKSKVPGAAPFHELLGRMVKLNLHGFRILLSRVHTMVEAMYANNSKNSDVEKCKAAHELMDHPIGFLGVTEERASMYKAFLLSYIAERDISEADLLNNSPYNECYLGDEDDETLCPSNSSLHEGVDSITQEYFKVPHQYAFSAIIWDYPLRAYATNRAGTPVCVGIVMVHREQEDNWVDSKHMQRDAIRMQGIVGCAIYRTFYHAPIGNTFLRYVQNVAAREGRIILVAPISNLLWEDKLRAAENVVIGMAAHARVCT